MMIGFLQLYNLSSLYNNIIMQIISATLFSKIDNIQNCDEIFMNYIKDKIMNILIDMLI